jgi:hypothetical protein
MKNLGASVIASLLFAAMARPIAAQTIKSPVVFTKVPYSPKLPNQVRQQLPATGTTRFWGKSSLKHLGRPVWAHVYDIQKTDFNAKFNPKDYAPVEFGEPDKYDGVQKSAVDLWLHDEFKDWQRISHDGFEYLRFGIVTLDDDANGRKPTEGSFERVDVQTFWLDTKGKSKPIFQVDLINLNSFFGANILHTWVTFANGLKQRPAVQAFPEAYSGLSSRNISTVSTDVMGNILVEYHQWSHGSAGRESTLKWRGKRFEE